MSGLRRRRRHVKLRGTRQNPRGDEARDRSLEIGTGPAHLTTATAMYREMDMRFWPEQAQAETGGQV
jgi:hypothetical protein